MAPFSVVPALYILAKLATVSDKLIAMQTRSTIYRGYDNIHQNRRRPEGRPRCCWRRRVLSVNDLLERLKPKERRGSKPRCHLLTHGSASEVASALTSLVAPFAQVSSNDRWMPDGFLELEEAQLDKASKVLDIERRMQLASWWLPGNRQTARTPNFDIASTCTVGGVPGLLLIEAKAHDEELRKEEVGRRLDADASDERRASHLTIEAAINFAARGFEQSMGGSCGISRDSHYQMSNRFAWAFKLTELGIPVVLVYLGFLRAEEMRDRGAPFANHAEWLELVKVHSAPLFPDDPWDRVWNCNGCSFVPLIRSVEQPLAEVT